MNSSKMNVTTTSENITISRVISNTSFPLKLLILLKIVLTSSGQIKKYYMITTQTFMTSGTVVLYNTMYI